MDLLLLLLIIVAVIALSGWGYGTYTTRAVPAETVVAGPAWVSPLGILGMLTIIAIVAMMVTGWRPFVVVQ